VVASAEDVRRFALSFPDVTEKPSYGTPGFRVHDRLFARLRPEDDSVVAWCDSIDDKQALIESERTKFFSTPHYDGQPLVLVRLSAVADDELWEILADSWRVRAPQRLRAQFDASSPRPPR
jgi:hypothetical protein